VLRAGGDWETLAVNDLGEGFYATPALSGGRIYLRGGEALYCFGNIPGK
jgi:outer membrane protein assembly factor BamB